VILLHFQSAACAFEWSCSTVPVALHRNHTNQMRATH
jgi:hypothetical protein